MSIQRSRPGRRTTREDPERVSMSPRSMLTACRDRERSDADDATRTLALSARGPYDGTRRADAPEERNVDSRLA